MDSRLEHRTAPMTFSLGINTNDFVNCIVEPEMRVPVVVENVG